MTLADRIVVMRGGEIEQMGSPMEIYSNPVNSFVADFFGSPSMNLLAGEVIRESGALRFRASSGFAVPLPDRFNGVPAGPVTLGIRPEHISAVPPGNGATSDMQLPVRLVEPLGKETLLYFDVGMERPFVTVSDSMALAELDSGVQLGLTLARDQICLFGSDGHRIRSGPAAA